MCLRMKISRSWNGKASVEIAELSEICREEMDNQVNLRSTPRFELGSAGFRVHSAHPYTTAPSASYSAAPAAEPGRTQPRGPRSGLPSSALVIPPRTCDGRRRLTRVLAAVLGFYLVKRHEIHSKRTTRKCV